MSSRLISWSVLTNRIRHQVQEIGDSSTKTSDGLDVNMKNAFKVVVLGSPRVGKTTIIDEAIYGSHYRLNIPYEPTIEDVYCAMVEYDRNMREKIFFYDYAGVVLPLNSDTFKMYLSFCDAFLLVSSLNDKDSFVIAAQIKKNIDKFKDKKDIPIVMIINKMDKINEIAINIEEIRKWALNEKVKLFETSAHDRKSISDCFIYLASKLFLVSKSSFSRKSKTGSLQLEL